MTAAPTSESALQSQPTDAPPLRTGIPTLAEVDTLLDSPLFATCRQFNADFVARHAQPLKRYAWHWGLDPLRFWSRRWEYPFAVQKTLDHLTASDPTAGEQHIVDAGSGVTFFPYLLCKLSDRARLTCSDYNARFGSIFDEINAAEPGARVSFKAAPLQQMPFDKGGVDALCCISVLEHTGQYPAIVEEFARIIRPGGRLVLTFDLAFDRFDLKPAEALDLIDRLGQSFEIDGPAIRGEIESAEGRKPELLCTTTIRQRQPELLPWRFPRLQALYDFVRGYGFTGGFRDCAAVCLDLVRK